VEVLTEKPTDTTTPLPVPSPAVTTADESGPPELPLVVIEPQRAYGWSDLNELWRFRELFLSLTMREIKVRYKQTILSVGWAVFQPLATLLVFCVFIGWMGKVSQGIENYVLFVLCGVIPWTFISNAVTNAGNCLVANERLVTKTYFPRLFLPMSYVGAALFDCLIGIGLIAIWVLITGPLPTISWLLVPVLLILMALISFGLGVLLSALIAVQRDFRYILAFGVQLWMFATPCIYLPIERSPLPAVVREFLAINPAHGLVLNFRHAILGTPIEWLPLAISTLSGLAILVLGLRYFRNVEQTLADNI
jgi:lipopolysaccharide transport system permease protein